MNGELGNVFNNAAITPIAVVMILVLLLFSLALLSFKFFLWWRVFSKAGYSGVFGLLLLVPFGTMIILCILAFSHWPIFKSPDVSAKQNLET